MLPLVFVVSAIGLAVFCCLGWGLSQSALHKAEGELMRIKSGDLTKAEFNNLCHNLHLLNRPLPITRKEFEIGCEQTQCRLFGEAK